MLQREVAHGIHRVEDAATNWYLVAAEDGITVVDAGLPASWKSLQSALRELGRRLGDVRALILTHAHFDHVGFAERARAELGIPVWCHVDEVPVARHPLRYRFERNPLLYARYPKNLPILGRLILAGAPVTKGIANVQTFTAEGELDVPGRPRVVFTPGHTFGHVAFHFPERDVLIAGDAVVTLDPYTGRRGPRLVSRAATADVDRARASLDAIAATGARTVLVGHGDPWHDGAEAIADAARREPQA